MAVQPIPDGYHEVTPFLVPNDASAFIDFATKGLGAKVRMRMAAPGDKVAHCELAFGNSIIMVADAGMGEQLATATVHLYVPDVDATFKQALAAGATAEKQPEDQFYGDRLGTLKDPFGNRWHISTHVEEVSEDQMKQRSEALQGA